MKLTSLYVSQDKSLGELNVRFNFLRKFSTNTKTTVFLAKVRALGCALNASTRALNLVMEAGAR
jgi:SNF2 family DNA or RNA helicase